MKYGKVSLMHVFHFPFSIFHFVRQLLKDLNEKPREFREISP